MDIIQKDSLIHITDYLDDFRDRSNLRQVSKKFRDLTSGDEYIGGIKISGNLAYQNIRENIVFRFIHILLLGKNRITWNDSLIECKFYYDRQQHVYIYLREGENNIPYPQIVPHTRVNNILTFILKFKFITLEVSNLSVVESRGDITERVGKFTSNNMAIVYDTMSLLMRYNHKGVTCYTRLDRQTFDIDTTKFFTNLINDRFTIKHF